ncbi:hypothetical protein LCGC14_1665400 [marine sediment metagenome]|uniref:Uncharacterized protein n=1 Tax=marine sediment metagenome TaxID=412755 RepID=A0A0F9K8N6_9ZZZZ
MKKTVKRYRVLLPVDIGGRIYNFGEEVELELDEAVKYSHALIAAREADLNHRGTEGTEEEQDGRDS